MTIARRILPPEPPETVEVGETIEAAPRPAPEGRPWVVVVFIASADGSATLSGRSGGLGGPADREAFQAHRHMADLILAGSGTAKAERYGPPDFPDDVRARRRARGQRETPRIAAVSGSLGFSFEEPLFSPEDPPILVSSKDADPERRDAAAERADLILAGEGEIDLSAVLAHLAEEGIRLVTCEGGPTLFGALLGADLVDELALTVAPSSLVAAARGSPSARRRASAGWSWRRCWSPTAT